jgi:peptidoglycan/xylan/chitin deacetylase (PgdA/CDA1 family)
MTRVAVLTYHSIDRTGSVLSVSPEEFRAHVEAIAKSGRPVIPPSRLTAPFSSAPPVADGSFALTFDDGYASVAEHAAAVLEAHGFPYALFLVTSRVGLDNAWPSQPPWVPRAPLMGWDIVAALASRDAEIGAHTRDHADLTLMPGPEAREQLESSAAEIRRRIGRDPRLFAYPGGRSTPAVRGMAAALFSASFSTRHARTTDADDRSDLPRVETFYFRDPGRFRRLFSPSLDLRLAARRALRGARRLRGER